MVDNDDDEALAAAYAALGHAAPLDKDGLEMSSELISPSAKAALRDAARGVEATGPIKLRELQ